MATRHFIITLLRAVVFMVEAPLVLATPSPQSINADLTILMNNDLQGKIYFIYTADERHLVWCLSCLWCVPLPGLTRCARPKQSVYRLGSHPAEQQLLHGCRGRM